MSEAQTSREPGSPEQLLVRGLGVRQLGATIFNATVGSGIFVLPAVTAATLGTAAPLAYLVCAAAMALIVLVCAEAGSRVAVSGGPYAYVSIGLGRFPGLLAGLLLSLSNLSAAGAIAVLLGQILGRVVAPTPAIAAPLITVTLIGALCAINLRGLAWGARTIEFFTVAKLVPLLLFVAVGALFVDPANLRWDSTPSAAQTVAAAGTLIFAFFGVENALSPGGEVRDPARTVPRAALLVIGAVTLLYLAIQAVALGILGTALADDRVAPLATAAGAAIGPAGTTLLFAGAAISMLGFLTGTLLTGPRVLFALGRDGVLPAPVSAVHPRYRTPAVAILLYGALALAVSLSGSFEQLAVLSNVSALLMYSLVAVAVLRMRRRGIQGDAPPFVAPGGPLVPLLTVMACVAIASQTITVREFTGLAIATGLAALTTLVSSRVRRASS
jgi:amino acid transporter